MRTSRSTPPRTVTSAQLRRLGGVALTAAFPLQVLGFALHPAGEQLVHIQQAAYGPSHLVLFVSWFVAMLGLPSLFGAVAERVGRTGVVALALTAFAVAYHLYLTLYEATVIPIAAALPNAAELVGEGRPLAHGAGALGPLAGLTILAFPLLGVAILRSRALPRAAGWLQVAAVPAFVVLMVVIGVVTGGAVGPDASHWLGGMLPIATLYAVAFAGYAVAGLSLARGASATSTVVLEDERILDPTG